MQVDVKTVRHPIKQLQNVIGLRQIRHSSSLEISLLLLKDFVQYIWCCTVFVFLSFRMSKHAYISYIYRLSAIQSRTVSAVHQKTFQLALSETALLSMAATLQIPGTHQGLPAQAHSGSHMCSQELRPCPQSMAAFWGEICHSCHPQVFTWNSSTLDCS